jgi:hypothetical protein
MRMKRLSLKHNYHDGIVRSVEYRNSEEIAIEVDLCTCGNPDSSCVHLTFTGVRNFEEVQKALEGERRANSEKRMVAEIVGFVRHEERGYILDLGSIAGLHIDAKGFLET